MTIPAAHSLHTNILQPYHSGWQPLQLMILLISLMFASYRKRSYCSDPYIRGDRGLECAKLETFAQLTEVPTKEFASLNKSASPTSTSIAPSGTGGIVSRVNNKSSIDSATCTSVSFEDYWCVNWAYDYSADPGAGGIGADSHDYAPFFLDLNDSSKDFCLSLEKANCSSWAAATPTQPGYPTWSPTITSPCCNSY